MKHKDRARLNNIHYIVVLEYHTRRFCRKEKLATGSVRPGECHVVVTGASKARPRTSAWGL